jgi:thiol-disulfide isomerase/thioredoxin
MTAMHERCPESIRPVHPVRASVGLACYIALAACIGCSKTSVPPPAPGPVFMMPSVGDPTDTSLRIGDDFPELRAVDLDGNAVHLDKRLLGERCTLIVFWSTWCGHCMKELPHEVQLAKQYEKAGLRVIGVNADDTTKIAKAAATDNRVPWLNVFEGPEKTISNKLGVKEWPVILLLGPDGKVIAATKQLRSIAAELLPDGSVRTVNGLDWILKELLDGN